MSNIIKIIKKSLGLQHLQSNLVYILSRRFSEASPSVTEENIKELLNQRFANAKNVKVQDVSGGCGAMFDIYVETSEFKGLSVVKQHKAITETLKDQIKLIHGLRIETKVPS